MNARTFLPVAAAGLAAVASSACRRAEVVATPDARATLAEALQPAAIAARLGSAGGAHVRGRARFRVAALAGPDAGFAAAQDVSTTTEIWLDGDRHYHLVESNDHDGGREVVASEAELLVGLRHGRLVRQPPDERMATRILDEGLGGPWAVWDLVENVATVTSPDAQRFVVGLGHAERHTPTENRADSPLRSWRGRVVIDDLEGEVTLGKGAIDVKLAGRFRAVEGKQPVAGLFDVTLAVDRSGSPVALDHPDAGDLWIGQRTILEERALLSDLPGRRDPGKVAGPPSAPTVPR